uniref:Zinc finger, CCHC-type n=1 Tax=Tanacetum cinerariifolium TaxID=118510 RepID=A0A6L2J703_TANCI|nr:zinc finger, CCHC-type [Tanacetum cinerariifolium]
MWCLFDPKPFGLCKTNAHSTDFGEYLSEAWTHFKDLLLKVPYYGLDLWLQVQIFYDHVDYTTQMAIDYAASGRLRKLRPANVKQHDASIAPRAIALSSIRGSCDELHSRSRRERVKQLEEYMCIIGSDFMQISSKVVGKLKEEIRMEENKTKKIEKITRYPDTEDLEPLNGHKFSKALTEKAFFHTLKFASPKLLGVKYVCTVFPSSPLVRESTFGFKPEKVEETIGILMEVEPLHEPQQEDLGLNTCNHDIPLSSREVPSFNEPKPQPQPLTNCPPLDVNLGDKREIDPPIKPHSPDSFRMKVVDKSTINTPPSPHVASFHPKDIYCYYHSCLDDPKKHYGFKPGLLGQSRSLGVDFSNMEMIENDWDLESKEVSFLGRGLNLPVRPKDVEKVKIKDSHHLKHIFQHKALSYHNDVYSYYHPYLNSSVEEPSPLSVKQG